MLAKISKYAFEIIAGIAIFIAIIYFLPSNNVQIPDIGELKLETVDLAFVVEEEINNNRHCEEDLCDDVAIQDITETGSIIDEDKTDVTIQEEAEAIVADIIETEYLAQHPPMDISIDSSLIVSGKDTDASSQELEARSYSSCTTPRNTRINHGDSVLAYEQRSDDPGVCNVQRRVCDDGTLRGSYTQSSCREYMGFDVQRQEVVTYNVPSTNPLIQPQRTSQTNTSSSQFIPAQAGTAGSSPSVGNSGVRPFASNYEFARSDVPTQGQRPFTNTNNSVSSSSTVRDGTTCSTPRGEEVRNGQFVKAYKLDRGFSNLPCEVELRYCVQSNLEGTFQYPRCQHYDIAVEDYLIGHYDPNVPSLQHLVEILHGSADDMPANYGQKPSVWERIKGFFQRLL